MRLKYQNSKYKIMLLDYFSKFYSDSSFNYNGKQKHLEKNLFIKKKYIVGRTQRLYYAQNADSNITEKKRYHSYLNLSKPY